ncbi:MAG: DUF551 domain-containing protein [Muribaculaceae bacterium]|nr:DUF551 domain-containing protein [Muribaculaceae bacterium]
MRWIKMTNIMPEMNKPVLVYDNNTGRMCITCRLPKGKSITGVNMWVWSSPLPLDVSWWMPLPPTPIEELASEAPETPTPFNAKSCSHYGRFGKCTLTRKKGGDVKLIACRAILAGHISSTGRVECPNYVDKVSQ